ncbi:MAG: YbjQ family protein [Planctomycetota bacterium]
MILSTTEQIAERTILKTLGIAKGTATRTRNLLEDASEWFRNLVGAELENYTAMLAEAREQALARLSADAERLGADAVVGVRITTNYVATGAAEVMAYGTAVKLG